MVITPARPATTPPPPQQARKGWWFALRAGALVMIFVVPAIWLFRAVGQQNGHPLAATPGTTGTIGQRSAPGSTLAAAANALIASPPQVQPGRYQFVAVEQWARSGDGISPRRLQHWRAEDGSGRIVTAVLPTLDTGAFRSVSVGHTDFSAAQVTAEDYPAGQLSETLQNPSSDPQILLQQLHTIEPADNGPAGVLRAVASLYDYANPDPSVRAAALNVLAGVEGLIINDLAIDPLGRPGIAITASSTTSSDTLIIDPRTGLALSLRQTYTLRNLAPALHQHVIYLQSGRTDMLEPVQGP